MQSEALLKEHEVRRRDLLILKYDKQRTLCDEIIQRQRALIEGIVQRPYHNLNVEYSTNNLTFTYGSYQ